MVDHTATLAPHPPWVDSPHGTPTLHDRDPASAVMQYLACARIQAQNVLRQVSVGGCLGAVYNVLDGEDVKELIFHMFVVLETAQCSTASLRPPCLLAALRTALAVAHFPAQYFPLEYRAREVGCHASAGRVVDAWAALWAEDTQMDRATLRRLGTALTDSAGEFDAFFKTLVMEQAAAYAAMLRYNVETLLQCVAALASAEHEDEFCARMPEITEELSFSLAKQRAALENVLQEHLYSRTSDHAFAQPHTTRPLVVDVNLVLDLGPLANSYPTWRHCKTPWHMVHTYLMTCKRGKAMDAAEFVYNDTPSKILRDVMARRFWALVHGDAHAESGFAAMMPLVLASAVQNLYSQVLYIAVTLRLPVTQPLLAAHVDHIQENVQRGCYTVEEAIALFQIMFATLTFAIDDAGEEIEKAVAQAVGHMHAIAKQVGKEGERDLTSKAVRGALLTATTLCKKAGARVSRGYYLKTLATGTVAQYASATTLLEIYPEHMFRPPPSLWLRTAITNLLAHRDVRNVIGQPAHEMDVMLREVHSHAVLALFVQQPPRRLDRVRTPVTLQMDFPVLFAVDVALERASIVIAALADLLMHSSDTHGVAFATRVCADVDIMQPSGSAFRAALMGLLKQHPQHHEMAYPNESDWTLENGAVFSVKKQLVSVITAHFWGAEIPEIAFVHKDAVARLFGQCMGSLRTLNTVMAANLQQHRGLYRNTLYLYLVQAGVP